MVSRPVLTGLCRSLETAPNFSNFVQNGRIVRGRGIAMKLLAQAGFVLFLVLGLDACVQTARSAEMPWIKVSGDKKGFVTDSGKRFVPWGVNYDHDDRGRLLEDYWVDEWPMVEQHFAAIRDLKCNVVRIHLQFGKFMKGPSEPDRQAHENLSRLLALAERTNLYLDLTGLGCYHKQDVPGWYDDLDEAERWEAQAVFWKSVAETCKGSPAVFCYDLMNEPVSPGGRSKARDWLGPAFAGKHFVQRISLDQRDRPRPEIAVAWLKRLNRAIRDVDTRHLITVGLVDWSLDRPGLTSGFVPSVVVEHVDFLCVHLYPEAGKLKEAQQTLAGFAVGKPVVIEETFPLKCSSEELAEFFVQTKGTAAGWISFYWGKPIEELKKSRELGDAILLQWLLKYERLSEFMLP